MKYQISNIKYQKWRTDCRGISILEVLVAMAIFLLVSVAAVEIFLWGFRGRDVVWEQLTTQNEGRKVTQDFINQLRRAGQSSVGGYALEQVSNSQIIFYSNIDSDTWLERVRYFLDGTILKLGVTKPTGTPLAYNLADEVVTAVVHDVANTTTPLFFYYDANYTGAAGTPLAAPIDISVVRTVGIKLLLEEKPNVSPAPFVIETKTTIRNLKTN